MPVRRAPEAQAVRKATRLESLAGMRIAVLDTGMRGTETLVAALTRALAETARTDVRTWHKTDAYRVAGRKLIEELARESDAVVTGVPD